MMMMITIIAIIIVVTTTISIRIGWLQAAPEEVSVQREGVALSQLPHVQTALSCPNPDRHTHKLMACCRLHLRKCQCREKTPPCRNCPMCKENSDIMALNDPNLQFQLCQVRFKCDICACR